MINPGTNRYHSWIFIFIATLLLYGEAAAAPEPIAKVIFAVGEVTAQDNSGATRPLERRGVIFQGDILTTSAGARCQIRFSDGSLLALPESSQFRVDEYSYGEPDGNEKAIYSLLKGGMRTITGAIGKKEKENYKVNTPVATIGIRGTAYHAFLHQLPSGEVQLYGGVKSGMISVDNGAGSTLFKGSENFHVVSSREAAQFLLTLPDFYPSESEDEPASDNGEESEPEAISDSALSDEKTATTTEGQGVPITTQVVTAGQTDEVPQSTEIIDNVLPVSSQPAPTGSMVAIAFTGSNAADGTMGHTASLRNVAPNELYLDTVDGIGNIPVGAFAYDTQCNPCSFVPGTATLVDTGGDPIGVNWGRWNGDYVIMENGVLTATSGSFHYIYTPNVTPLSVVQARTGFTSYSFAGGGTAPTDQAGNIGTLNYLDMSVDFDLQQISSVYLGATVGTFSIVASSMAPVAITDAISSSGGIDMQGTDTALDGHIDMSFVGPNAEAIAASYGFQSTNLPSTMAITGTALLKEGAGGQTAGF